MHWYTHEGKPAYEVRAADGTMRATTLRDARKLGLVPSVTTVLAVAAKDGLVNWQIDQAIMAALTLPRESGESLDDFVIRAKRDAGKQAKDAAARGTEIHDAIEAHFLGKWVPPILRPYALAAHDALVLRTGKAVWHPEASFASPEGYGGKVDLHSRGSGWVVDWKGKAGLRKAVEDGRKLAYDEHAMQLAAYAEGLGMPEARRLNVFVDRDEPFAVAHEWPVSEHGEYMERFRCLLRYWQLKNRYTPNAQAVAA